MTSVVATHEASLDLEANEATIRSLRAEAKQRLEAVTTDDEDIEVACRLVFDILDLQDQINRDHHRISRLTVKQSPKG